MQVSVSTVAGLERRIEVAVPAERVSGSVIAAASAWSAGVRIFRVHDVAATRQALLVAKAILEAGPLD